MILQALVPLDEFSAPFRIFAPLREIVEMFLNYLKLP